MFFRMQDIIFNPCGESDQLIVHLNFAKNCWAKRSLKRVARLRVKIIEFSDTKLRFALLAQQFLAKFVKIMTIFRAI